MTPSTDRELYESYLIAYCLAYSNGITEPRVFRPLGEETSTALILAMVLGVEDAHTSSRRPWPEVKAAIEEELKASGVEE